MIELRVGDIGMCESGTKYYAELGDMGSDLLGGNCTLSKDTVFIVLDRQAIGTAGKGWMYKAVFSQQGAGWVNATNVVPCFSGPDEEG